MVISAGVSSAAVELLRDPVRPKFGGFDSCGLGHRSVKWHDEHGVCSRALSTGEEFSDGDLDDGGAGD